MESLIKQPLRYLSVIPKQNLLHTKKSHCVYQA